MIIGSILVKHSIILSPQRECSHSMDKLLALESGQIPKWSLLPGPWEIAGMKLKIRGSEWKWILKCLKRKPKPLSASALSLGKGPGLSPGSLSLPHLGRNARSLDFLPCICPQVSIIYNPNSLQTSNYQKRDPIKPSALYLNLCNITPGKVVT